jgi:adenylosuccinate lyase
VRRVAVRSLDSGVAFSKAIQEDAFVSKRLTLKEIKETLDYRNYLGVTSQLINMALNE